MHPALRNLEVIHTISSYTERGTLPALAATCRAFEHPALNVLWRDLDSVEPLIRCVPGDLFSFLQGSVVLLQPLDNKMWDTLSRYTSRVHSITQIGNSTFIEPLGLIMLSCPSASLFPNLRKLTWHADGTRSAAEFLRMAFVPSLQTLNIRSYPTSLAFSLVFSSLGTLCPRLQSLILPHRSVIEFSMLPFVIQPISQLHHLRTLDVPDPGKQGIQHIMLLRALQSLYLDLRQSTPSTWDIQSPSQFSGFQDLQSLYLGVSTFERPSNFLSSLRIVRSRKFAVRVGFASQVAQSPAHVSTMLPQFLAILQERCDNDRLQCFYIFGYLNMVLTESGVFTPLRAFSNLTVLFIERGCDISMSDEELCHLTGALPKLRILKINCCVTVDTTTVPTFHGLIGIIRLCPVLTSLALVIDTTKLDGIDIRNPGGGENFKTYLNNLTLGNSIIDSPLNVALILSGISPRLKQVNLDCWDTAPMNLLPQKKSAMEQWVLVNSFLSGFGVVRERPGLIVT